MSHAKNASDWGRDKAKQYADGGAVEPTWANRYVGRARLRDEMGGTPPPMGFDNTRTKTQAGDTMRGQMERAKDISDAVPRKAGD